ncbi:hypothetical protein B7992_11745 [Fibrobacter sp. UWH1]|nr:hypothetical protein B7992_11745 [Fibrobacter sp. UWH1]
MRRVILSACGAKDLAKAPSVSKVAKKPAVQTLRAFLYLGVVAAAHGEGLDGKIWSLDGAETRN